MGEKKHINKIPQKIPGQSRENFVYVIFFFMCFFRTLITPLLNVPDFPGIPLESTAGNPEALQFNAFEASGAFPGVSPPCIGRTPRGSCKRTLLAKLTPSVETPCDTRSCSETSQANDDVRFWRTQVDIDSYMAICVAQLKSRNARPSECPTPIWARNP